MLFFTVLKISLGLPREHLMIYRGPGFLSFVYFGPSSTPLPLILPSASCLSFSVFPCLLTKDGVGGGGGAQAFYNDKALPSINHSILSGYSSTVQFVLAEVSTSKTLA
jgi:hypothetical protein